MKRRGFLGLLGLAPVAPLIAKEIAENVRASSPPPDFYPMASANWFTACPTTEFAWPASERVRKKMRELKHDMEPVVLRNTIRGGNP